MSQYALILNTEIKNKNVKGFGMEFPSNTTFAVDGDASDEQKELLKTKNLDEVLFYNLAFTIMKCDKDKSFNKAGIETLINLLEGFVQKSSRNATKDSYSKGEDEQVSEDGIPIEMIYKMRELVSVLQYMINCTSWQKGKFYSFDRFEIENSLKDAIK